jgi:hypothetical protein
MLPTSIGVFGSPECLTMVGTARKVGRTEEDLAVWSPRVRMDDVQGRWIIVDGSFLPVEQSTKVGDPASPVEDVATRGRANDSVGKIWNAMWLLGFFGLCGAIPWTITTWGLATRGQGNRLVVAGALFALGSLVLMMAGRLNGLARSWDD